MLIWKLILGLRLRLRLRLWLRFYLRLRFRLRVRFLLLLRLRLRFWVQLRFRLRLRLRLRLQKGYKKRLFLVVFGVIFFYKHVFAKNVCALKKASIQNFVSIFFTKKNWTFSTKVKFSKNKKLYIFILMHPFVIKPNILLKNKASF